MDGTYQMGCGGEIIVTQMNKSGSKNHSEPTSASIGGFTMQPLAGSDPETLSRACVDCGLITGSFCDYCLAADRIPEEKWEPGQCTPLCTKCDTKNDGICHFCRGVAWVAPQSHVGK